MRSLRNFSFKNHCNFLVINELQINSKPKCVIWVKKGLIYKVTLPLIPQELNMNNHR